MTGERPRADLGREIEALRRELYNATVGGIRRVHADLMVLRVRPDAPIPPYEAGQWIALGIGLWEPPVPGLPAEELTESDLRSLVRRPFSISSAIVSEREPRLLRPGEEDFYEFYLALHREAPRPPAISTRLFALEPGSRLWIAVQPRGQNTLAGVRPDDDVLFAATGTGEAPHNRMIWELLRRGHRGRVAAVVTARHQADLGYREAHERAMRLFPNYRYAPVTTREPGDRNCRMQDLLRSGALEAMAGFRLEPSHARVFLCGNPGMIGAPRVHPEGVVYPPVPGMVELLERERGYRADPRRGNINIHFERY
jgi:ferredoxin--NADP+ reductase